MTGMLEGLRAVEVAEGISGPYCGKLLADLGAEVIKVERPPAGDPCRYVAPFYHDEPTADSGLLFNYLNTNKLGVTLDVRNAEDRTALGRLLGDVDVLICSGSVEEIDEARLRFSELSGLYPRLVCTYIVPFGLDGERSSWKAGELVAFHMSGLGLITPDEKGKPMQPPLKAGGHQALMVAGMTAAVATMHALFAREATGRGQQVDVSEVDPLASFQFMNVGRWTYMRDPGRRGFKEGNRRVWCRDGAVSLLFGQDHQWRAMIEVMGNPEWACAPEYETRAGRTAHSDVLWAQIQAWAADYTKGEIYRMGQRHRIPVFPENSIAEAIDSAQVRSREFIREIPLANGASVRAPTRPFASSRFAFETPRPAPRLGEHQAQVLGERPRVPGQA